MSAGTSSEGSAFRQAIEAIMARLPAGCVTTYGDVAARAGHPYAARAVGGVAHYGDPHLPWHRLVNQQGGLARGYPGGMEVQRRHLEEEGIHCAQYRVVNFEALRWKGGPL